MGAGSRALGPSPAPRSDCRRRRHGPRVPGTRPLGARSGWPELARREPTSLHPARSPEPPGSRSGRRAARGAPSPHRPRGDWKTRCAGLRMWTPVEKWRREREVLRRRGGGRRESGKLGGQPPARGAGATPPGARAPLPPLSPKRGSLRPELSFPPPPGRGAPSPPMSTAT